MGKALAFLIIGFMWLMLVLLTVTLCVAIFGPLLGVFIATLIVVKVST